MRRRDIKIGQEYMVRWHLPRTTPIRFAAPKGHVMPPCDVARKGKIIKFTDDGSIVVAWPHRVAANATDDHEIRRKFIDGTIKYKWSTTTRTVKPIDILRPV